VRILTYANIRVLNTVIPPIEELDLLHREICYALADPKRLQILYLLAEQPSQVGQIATRLEMPQSTVSRHLTILRQRNLVVGIRTANTIEYRLVNDQIIQAMEIMRSLLGTLVQQEAAMLKLPGGD